MKKYLLFLFSLFIFSANSIADCGGDGGFYQEQFRSACEEDETECPEGTIHGGFGLLSDISCIPCDSTSSIVPCSFQEARARCPNRYIKSGGCDNAYSVLSCSDDMTRDFLSTFIETFFFPFVSEAAPGEIVTKGGTYIDIRNRSCYNPHIIY